MSNHETLDFEEHAVDPPWLHAAVSAVVIAMGWVLFELTGQPALGIIAACTTFGWNDLRTAFWLWRRDRHRGRGRTCGLFYAASALWKVTVTGVLVGIPLLIVHDLINRRPQPVPIAFVPMLVAMVCFGLLSLTVVLAMWTAWWYRVKVWLDPAVHWSRREQVWPPKHFTFNRMPRLLLTALLPPALIGMIGLISAAVAAADQAGRAGPLTAMITMTTLVSGGIALLVVRQWALHKLAARWPAECWHERFDEEFNEKKLQEPAEVVTFLEPAPGREAGR